MVTSWEQTSTEESIDQRNVPTARTASTDQQAMFENGEQPSNGDNDRGKAREPRWRGAIRTFTPQWYSVSMDIGIISILMHQNYYHGSWLNILSTIMFVFNIVVYAFFTGILLLRLIMYPKAAASQSKSSDEQAASWCCPIIAWMTITAQVSLTVSQAYWGGYAWTMVAYVMWWIGQTWMLAIIAASIILFSKSDVVHDRTLSPSVFMLAVGSCTTASIGATIVNYSIDMNARLAVPVIVVSYMHVGLGALLGHMLYTLFLHRLMSSGPPPAQKVPSLVMMVGDRINLVVFAF
jgi:tellurite resistance protein TehA-like permease